MKEIERIGLEIEQLLKQVPGATDIVADRIVGKPYIQIDIDRDRIGRYGVNIRDVQDVIETAIGGMLHAARTVLQDVARIQEYGGELHDDERLR